jgi:hypothetical protein
MVAYENWVSVCRSEADRQGADLNDFEVNSMVVSVAGEVWRDRKDEIERANQTRAKEIARSELTVS